MESRQIRVLVAKNIRAIAKEKRMTLNRVADFAGVSKAQLYNVLGTSTSVSIDWLARIAEALEVEPWQLLAPRAAKRPMKTR